MAGCSHSGSWLAFSHGLLMGAVPGKNSELEPFISLAKQSMRISWGRYLRENWWVAVIVLGAAVAGLLTSNALLG